MLFFAQNGYRVVAHDRRGHGRSSQPSYRQRHGQLCRRPRGRYQGARPRDVTLVGHSTGGGEVARYIGRHGTSAGAKAVLIAAVPPIMLKTAGQPRGAADRRSSTTCARADHTDRSQFYRDLALAVLRRQPAGRRGLAGHRSTSSGSGACRSASRTPTSASRRSPRPTSPRTSRRSTFRHCSCTARTTRSSPSTTRP